jgi:hypothetical protein
MKNTGRLGAEKLILKTLIIVLIVMFIGQTYAQEITPEIITTQPKEINPGILNEIDRFYEISEKSLEIGYNVTLNTNSAFRITIGQRDRYIITKNFSKDQINLIFLGSGKTLFNRLINSGESIIFKIEDLNLQFYLHSANQTQARVELKLFEQEVPTDVEYFELFDIQVRLVEHTIYSPTDLSAMIEFTNFGEGPSHVRLIYSIINSDGTEVFTGIDEKIVETDEAMIKNFYTLNIPNGNYIVRTTIYYGDNQEATSEESFTLKEIPKSQLIKQPLFFIAIIIISFGLVIFFKKREKKNIDNIN